MQRFILCAVFMLISKIVLAQTICDYFVHIPDSSMLNITEESRQNIIDVSIDNKGFDDAYEDLTNYKFGYACDIVDTNNGYLRMFGAFEGHVQMCFWKLLKGNDLIAVYMEGCGPVCFVERFVFYEFDEGEFKAVDFEGVMPDVSGDFYKGSPEDMERLMKKNDVIASVLFELPRNGQDIVVKWGNEGRKEDYMDYVVGDRMLLKWNGDRFVKGEIYWSE